MEYLLDFGVTRFASEVPGRPEPVPGGLIIPPGRVSILHRMPDAEVYRHGWNSWSPTGWRRLADPPLRIASSRRRLTADDTAWDEEHRHHSAAVAALAAGDGRVLLLGALGLDVPRLAVDRDVIAGWYESAGSPWFCGYGPELEVFERYAGLLGERFGRGRNKVGPVWCSWYAYYEDIDERTLRRDLDDLAGLPFGVFQIDDGWQCAVGDWRPNARFSSGMDRMAGRIQAAGLVPGLWLAPFIATPDAAIVRDRPDLFLRDDGGNLLAAGYNWDGPYHALDLTLPEAQHHVTEVIQRVVGWGYRYLKLDFVNAAAVKARRHVPDTGRETCYRAAMQLIRQAAGPDVYLLGSGAPVLASIGVCDGIRIGPDVGPLWSHDALDDPSDASAQNALATSVNRLWLASLLDIDPDVVYFRSRSNLLSALQRRILADLAQACGFRSTSDPWSWLTDDERLALSEFVGRQLPVQRLGRYRVRLDGTVVDFAAVAGRGATVTPSVTQPLDRHGSNT
jgi:alpha-galactosidase